MRDPASSTEVQEGDVLVLQSSVPELDVTPLGHVGSVETLKVREAPPKYQAAGSEEILSQTEEKSLEPRENEPNSNTRGV